MSTPHSPSLFNGPRGRRLARFLERRVSGALPNPALLDQGARLRRAQRAAGAGTAALRPSAVLAAPPPVGAHEPGARVEPEGQGVTNATDPTAEHPDLQPTPQAAVILASRSVLPAQVGLATQRVAA